MARFIRQAVLRETCTIFGDGTQTRDFIFIDDLIDAVCLAAATEGVGGQIFQIATSAEKTVNEVSQTIKAVLNSQYGIMMQAAYSDPRIGDVRRNYSDTTKAEKILKWRAKTKFEHGVEKTIDWFLNTMDSSSKSSIRKIEKDAQCRMY
jgi:UDP-glucose 4-epimerase